MAAGTRLVMRQPRALGLRADAAKSSATGPGDGRRTKPGGWWRRSTCAGAGSVRRAEVGRRQGALWCDKPRVPLSPPTRATVGGRGDTFTTAGMAWPTVSSFGSSESRTGNIGRPLDERLVSDMTNKLDVQRARGVRRAGRSLVDLRRTTSSAAAPIGSKSSSPVSQGQPAVPVAAPIRWRRRRRGCRC